MDEICPGKRLSGYTTNYNLYNIGKNVSFSSTVLFEIAMTK